MGSGLSSQRFLVKRSHGWFYIEHSTSQSSRISYMKIHHNTRPSMISGGGSKEADTSDVNIDTDTLHQRQTERACHNSEHKGLSLDHH